jgi:hypothetical protein
MEDGMEDIMEDGMDEQELSPEQQAEIEAMNAEFMRQVERVGVEMEEAHPQLRALAPVVERRMSDDEFEVMITVDFSGILETLQGLPDGAGTAAFVAAYNARPHGVDPQAS